MLVQKGGQFETGVGSLRGPLHTRGEGTMKRSKFSEEQIAYGLRQVESGTAVGDSVGKWV